MGLQFEPLYFIYHDGWNFKETLTVPSGNAIKDLSKTYHHAGHVHLFMNGIDPIKNNVGQAYSGQQTYSMTIEDEWGPNSKDPNQNKSIKLIGKPVWYFYVEQYWRRVYLQPWSTDAKGFVNGLHNGKKGVKYDASKEEHSLGPFREGGELYFYNTVVNRTMPVEYWKEKTKHTRELYIRQKDGIFKDTDGIGTWTFSRINEFFQWVYDNHPQDEGWSNDYGRVYHIHRLRNFDNYENDYYCFMGTNAKLVKNIDEDKDEKDFNNEFVNPKLDWYGGGLENHSWNWQGWYEYNEIVKYRNPKTGEWQWYKRQWKPYNYKIDKFPINEDGYQETNSQFYSKSRRRNFPNPPPYLCKEYLTEDEQSEMRWEYLHYFGLVLDSYEEQKDNLKSEYGNQFDASLDNNDNFQHYDKIKWEYYKKDFADLNGVTVWTNQYDKACFQSYLSVIGKYFQQYMDKFDEDGNFYVFNYPNTDNNSALGSYQSINGTYVPCNLTYVTFSQFRTIWRKLDVNEIIDLKIYGDYPVRVKSFTDNTVSYLTTDIFENPFWQESDVATLSVYSAYSPHRYHLLQPYNALKLTHDITVDVPENLQVDGKTTQNIKIDVFYQYNELQNTYEVFTGNINALTTNRHEFPYIATIAGQTVSVPQSLSNQEYWSREEIEIPPLGDAIQINGENNYHVSNIQVQGGTGTFNTIVQIPSYSYKASRFEWSIDPNDLYKQYFNKKQVFTMPQETTTAGDYPLHGTDEESPLHPRELAFSNEDGARWLYPDDKYISPIIEYQKVVHLNYERLTHKRQQEKVFQSTWEYGSGAWGDGFSKTITIPYKINGLVQSPFSDDNNIVQPIGVYCHNVVKPQDMMRYHVEWLDTSIKLRKYRFQTYYEKIYVPLMELLKDLYYNAPEYYPLKDEQGNLIIYNEDVYGTDEDLQSAHDRLDVSAFAYKENESYILLPDTKFFTEFWSRKDAESENRWSETPVTKDNTENSFDASSKTFNSIKTQNMVTQNQVATMTDPITQQKTYGYKDSRGNIRKGGNVVTFNDPYKKGDGRWVEQCLGAIVKAKVVLVLQDALGHRWKQEVTTNQMSIDTPLTGSDYITSSDKTQEDAT